MEPPSLVPAALRYVEQVARSGSIQRAARELNVAASAIDRQILKLEASFGLPLFERLPRGMRITDAGSVIVALGRQWRGEERRATAELQQLQGINQGHVRLVAMDSHVNGLLPDFVEQMAQRHPRISLDVEIATTDAATVLLVNGSAEVAVAYNLQPRRDLHTLWSRELPFGCVVAPTHPLAQEGTASLQQIAAYPIALQNRSLMIRRFLDARHAWLFNDKQLAVETNSLQLIKLLAKRGRHAAFTSELDAAVEILEGSLVFVPVRDVSAEPQTVSVVIDGRRSLPRVAGIVADFLVERVGQQLEAIRQRREATRAGG
jgi:DNA-binding transcriptional LysR family regulator